MFLKSVLFLYFAYQALASDAKNKTDCQKFIDKFITNIQSGNLTNIPTIIYSGVTTNNPGQMKQCTDVDHYSYFLIYFNNVTDKFRTYTGACIPDVCNASTLEQALSSYNVTVQGYESETSADGLAIAGVVVISLWIAAVFVWSCVVSFKEEEAKKLMKKHDGGDRNSINSELEQPILQPVQQVVPDFKLFIFYEGYQQLFKAPTKISIFSPIIFLSVLSYLISIQFSYRLSISENQTSSGIKFLNSIWGVLACNTEIALHTIAFVLGLRLAYSAYRINSCKQIIRFYFDQVIKKWLLLILMTLMIYAFVTLFTSQPLNNVWNIRNGQDCPAYMWQMWFLFRNLLWDCKACLPWMSLIASEIFFMIISAPFLLVFKANRKLGYGLFSLLIINSMFISYAILDSSNINYEPYKLMNGQKQFTLDYQANSFVRMGAYFFGLMFGLFLVEGLQKTETQRSKESDLAKLIRRTNSSQIALQVVGFALMLTCYLLIIPYLSQSYEDKQPYLYLMLVPFFFLVGLALFMLPSFWQGQFTTTRFINSVLGWKKWVHLDRISLTYYMIGPMVMAYSNYSMQSSIYYDFPTVWTYAIGDLAIAYVTTLLVASTFEQQLNSLFVWLQYKVYGNESKYSVLVIEQQE